MLDLEDFVVFIEVDHNIVAKGTSVEAVPSSIHSNAQCVLNHIANVDSIKVYSEEDRY
jgi:hypothetical protein